MKVITIQEIENKLNKEWIEMEELIKLLKEQTQTTEQNDNQ